MQTVNDNFELNTNNRINRLAKSMGQLFFRHFSVAHFENYCLMLSRLI
jgi:hypothetical protein